MKNLNDRIQEQFLEETFNNIDNQIINEKLECDVLKNVAKQLIGQNKTQNANIKIAKKKYQEETGNTYWPGLDKSNNFVFKQIFDNPYGGQLVEWSKVTNKDVTVYEPEDVDKKTEKLVKEIINAKKEGIIIIQDPESNKFQYVIFTYGNVIRLEGSTNGDSHYYGRGATAGERVGYHGPRGQFKDLTKSEKLELIQNKRIYYIDATGKRNEWNKTREARYKSQKGMIPLDPELVKKIAQDNVERYRKIITQMRAKRENADELLEQCHSVIQKISDLAIEVAKDAIAQADMISPVAQLTNCIYDKKQWNEPNRYRRQGYYSGVDGLLPMIVKYTEARAKAAQGSYAEMYKKDMDSAKQSLKDTLNKIKNLAQKYNIDLGI